MIVTTYRSVRSVSNRVSLDGRFSVALDSVLSGERIRYTLDLVEERPHRVDWTLNRSKLFKRNTGSWALTALGDTLRYDQL